MFGIQTVSSPSKKESHWRASTLQKHVKKRYSLRAIFWLVAIVMGAVQGWAYRYTMWSDGISYLDMGDAYFRGDWNLALNGHWSPLYSWVLGLSFFILKPSPYWEFPLVHLVNFILYIVALVCFEFFLGELLFYYQNKVAIADGKNNYFKIPEWVWIVLGYTIFLWSSLKWIRVPVEDTAAVTPDMCATALVYIASGLLLRIYAKSDSWYNFIILGFVLGLSYLSKTAMFPLAFVFLGVSLFSVGNLRRAFPRVLVALLVFTITVAPFITAFSLAKGRLTYGDTGKTTYAWFVSGVQPGYRHWQGNPPDHGKPKHPTRQIFDNPPVYEFASPFNVSYAPWYDPSYWYEGVKTKFNLGKQLATIAKIASSYYKMFFAQLAFGYLIVACMGDRLKFAGKDLAQNWRILIPAIAGLGVYMLVYLEERYVASFVVLLFAGVLASVRLPDSQKSKKLITAMTLAALIVSGGYLAKDSINDVGKRLNTAEHIDWQVADGLNNQMGIKPGDKVGYIAYFSKRRQTIVDGAFAGHWARLARVRIVSEVDAKDADSFWSAEPSVQAEVIKAIASTGVKAIVSGNIPPLNTFKDWKKLGNTESYAYLIKEQSNQAAEVGDRAP